jgi:hypothetical protein
MSAERSRHEVYLAWRRLRCQENGGHTLGTVVRIGRHGGRAVVVARCEECETRVTRVLERIDERGLGARDPRARGVTAV